MKPEAKLATAAPQLLKPSPPRQARPLWHFALPLALQTALILALPARNAYTFATGTTVVLQTAPVDPYDFLRGYYQTLGYEISQQDTLAALPGGEAVFGEDRPYTDHFYVVLEPPTSETSPPRPWQPVRISGELPDDLTAGQIALRGEYRDWQITYGLERYYMPESQREAINRDIGDVQRSQPEAFRVEVKVGGDGVAVPVSLWVQERHYRF
ncbi:MAG: GDYXXLXY domain-containing protein [Spirulinaceae cyanobacterium SM2_1_0]|nr:GDYXXLXY domain-containing protein [Spirulinaceae cyanobacterium SM2_1_0]